MQPPLEFPTRADYFAAAKRLDPKALELSLGRLGEHVRHWVATGQQVLVALAPEYDR